MEVFKSLSVHLPSLFSSFMNTPKEKKNPHKTVHFYNSLCTLLSTYTGQKKKQSLHANLLHFIRSYRKFFGGFS